MKGGVQPVYRFGVQKAEDGGAPEFLASTKAFIF